MAAVGTSLGLTAAEGAAAAGGTATAAELTSAGAIAAGAGDTAVLTAAVPAAYSTAAGSGISSYLSTAGLASTAIGGVTQAIGSETSAAAAKQAALYNQTVAQYASTQAGQKAAQAMAAGEQQTYNQGLKTRAVVGSEQAAQAASGLEVNTGSNVDVRSSAAETGQLDQLTVQSNAARQAYGYQAEESTLTGQQGLYGAQAKGAGQAGDVGALSSVLGGATGVAKQYAAYTTAGGNGNVALF